MVFKKITISFDVIFCSHIFLDGKQKFPGVIDLFGNSGGLSEFRASLLASRGFCALALAYFDYDDLTQSAIEIDMEYFQVHMV